jgi:hypothetical protein
MPQVPASVHVVSASGVPLEQRSSERHPCLLEAVSCPLDAPETLCWGATVQDLSAGGIGLTLCYPFKPGTYLAINVQRPEEPCTLLGRVIHVSDQADGTWFIGCEFVKQIDNVVELLSRG